MERSCSNDVKYGARATFSGSCDFKNLEQKVLFQRSEHRQTANQTHLSVNVGRTFTVPQAQTGFITSQFSPVMMMVQNLQQHFDPGQFRVRDEQTSSVESEAAEAYKEVISISISMYKIPL